MGELEINIAGGCCWQVTRSSGGPGTVVTRPKLDYKQGRVIQPITARLTWCRFGLNMPEGRITPHAGVISAECVSFYSNRLIRYQMLPAKALLQL